MTAAEIERVFRAEYGRAVAVLVRVFRDVDIAEEAVQTRSPKRPGAGCWAGSPQPRSRSARPSCGAVFSATSLARTRCRPRSTPCTDTPSPAATDWRQVVALYDQLMVLGGTPVVALNRAVAVAEVDGPGTGLAIADGLDLGGYHLWHAIRADLLRRLRRTAEAAAAYDAAIVRTENAAEREVLPRARMALPTAPDEVGQWR